MDTILFYIARTAIALIQTLPIRWVARLGRCGGAVAFWVDARHRRVALANLTRCYSGEKTPAEIKSIAKENFRRLGEVYCCSVKSAAMSDAEIKTIFAVTGAEKIPATEPDGRLVNRAFTGGHFGNFELFTRISAFIPGYRCLATYRGINPPKLDRLVFKMRTVSGNLLFDRRTGADELKTRRSSFGGLMPRYVARQR